MTLATLALGAPGSAVETSVPSSFGTSVPGATIMGEQWLTKRTLQLTVATPSFTAPTQVEVLFPSGYRTQPNRRWPVTYYLNGTNGDQAWFRTAYNGEALSKSFPSIIVAPAGHAGYWSDWYNTGSGGPPKYERFVTHQLIPLIEANFRTLNDRAHRAILGESMGGYGTLMLAARHPDLFVAASSLSGAPDSNYVPGAAVLTASPAIDLAPPDSVYGPRASQEVRWHGHNPNDLAENLRPVDLQLYTGNGLPAPQEADAPPFLCVVESGVIQPETETFHQTLLALGIAHRFRTYDWGCHTPVMFQQEIAQTFPRFAWIFTQQRPTPAAFNFRSIQAQFHIFGWSVRADRRRALEFLDLGNVRRDGFNIAGSGRTLVTTPPLFRGAQRVTVLVNGKREDLNADNTGRLSITIDLGPPDQDQEYTSGADTAVHSSHVRFITG